MYALTDAANILIDFIGGTYLLIMTMRFVLQLVRADFYNPISQFIVKVTNPLLIPLRRMIPGFGGIDVASLILAFSIQCLLTTLLCVVNGIALNPLQIVLWSFVGFYSMILYILIFSIFIIAIASWISPNSYNPMLILLNQVIEPLARPVRTRMPDMGGLDISLMIVLLCIYLLQTLTIGPLALVVNLNPDAVFGI